MSRFHAARRFVRTALLQLFADRSALFFFFVLPVVVIVVVGSTFGVGGSLTVGVVGGERGDLARAITDALDRADGVRVERFDSTADLDGAIHRFAAEGGVVFADDVDAAVAAGEPAFAFVADPLAQGGLLARDVVVAAASEVLGPVDAARFAATTTGADVATAQATANGLTGLVPEVAVSTIDVGDGRLDTLSAFSLTAPQNLVLFVFINSLAAGAALMRMRRVGVLRRVMAGPTGAGTVMAGLTAAWAALALMQSVIILTIGGLVFGVDWGDPLAAAVLTVVFALVGAGAGLLVGVLFGNEDRVSSIGPPIGITLGALGGCMVPLEVFPAGMLTVAKAVPQYWAMTAWQRLVFDGDGLGDIAGPVLVLVGFAVLFVGLAAVRLRRMLLAG